VEKHSEETKNEGTKIPFDVVGRMSTKNADIPLIGAPL
jgi:hypothetical protein